MTLMTFKVTQGHWRHSIGDIMLSY